MPETTVCALARSEAGKRSRRRRLVQLLLWPVVAVTILGGLKYPLLGFTVPVVMVVGLVGALFRGRYVCGTLCPRGSFLDRVVAPIAPARPIPSLLRSPWFRWPVVALLMGAMAFQVAQDPGDLTHWGRVFVRICILTTGVGVVLALTIRPRSWCSFCPMGTLQNAIGGRKPVLYLGEGCRGCRQCERACPMNLSIIGDQRPGPLVVRDCLQCAECQLACPVKALRAA